MRSRRRIVEHVGSAHTEEQLAVLRARADEVIQAGQQVFDLAGLNPASPVVPAIITSSRARVLWEVLVQAWREIRFDAAVADEIFKQLVGV